MLCDIIGCYGVIVMLVLFIKVHINVRVVINVFDMLMFMLVLLMSCCYFYVIFMINDICY